MVGILASCRKKVVSGTELTNHDTETNHITETEPPVLTGVTQYISSNIKGYYQAVPLYYEESGTKKYPLLLSFHGGGQYGNGAEDLPEVLLTGIPKVLNEKKLPPYFTVGGKAYSFIIIAPQFVRMPTNNDVDSLLAHIEAKFRIDSTRMYLSGLSLGARMLSNYAAYKPAKIAALTSMGGLPQINDNLEAKCRAMVNARLPIWHFHNQDDSAWVYSEAVTYIDVLKSMNPVIAPKFTTFYPGEGKLQHDSWTRTTDPEYREDGKNIYEWMLNYAR